MILNLILLIISLIIAKFLYKLVLKPYLGVLYYRKQGLSMKFFPGSTGLVELQNDAIEKGDYFYSSLKLIEKDPRIKGFGFNTLDQPHIFLNDVDNIKDFICNIKDYEKSDNLFYLLKLWSLEGIAFANGAEWKRHRKAISTIFHYEYLQEVIPFAANIADSMLKRWKTEQKSIKNVSLLPLFTNITGEIVGQLFFGDNFSKYKVNGYSFQEMTNKLSLISFQTSMHPAQILFGSKFVHTKLLQCHRDYFAFVENFYELCKKMLLGKLNEMKEKKANGTYQRDPHAKKTLIELFQELRESGDPEKYFSDTELIHEFTTFFTAGTDSTSHLIYMATYYFSKNPECQEKLVQEIDQHFKPYDELNGDDLNKMTYMNAFLKETLRMFGPAAGHFEKEALRDNRIGNLNVKKGTLVNIQMPVLHQNPLYYEDPMQFKVERWLDSNSKTMQSVKNHPYCYIPFYAGPRNCIGQNMAMIDSKIILSIFIKMFKTTLSDPSHEPKRTIKFAVEPVDPIYFDLEQK